MVSCTQCGDNKVIMARQVKKEEVESNPAFSEFLQMSRGSSPVGLVRRTSTRISNRSTRSSCRHRGTPGHRCGSTSSGGTNSHRRASSRSYDPQTQTSLNNGSSELTAAKNGSNGRANSIHMMESMMGKDHEKEENGRHRIALKDWWYQFMQDREDYSMWLFKRDHP